MMFASSRSLFRSSYTPESPAARSRKLHAGVATLLIALTLLAGFGRPAETAAYKDGSLVCSTIEAGFQYTFDKALAAKVVGDTKSFEYWNAIAQATQGLWFIAGCGEGSPGDGYRAT